MREIAEWRRVVQASGARIE
jgi:hypothetical protein